MHEESNVASPQVASSLSPSIGSSATTAAKPAAAGMLAVAAASWQGRAIAVPLFIATVAADRYTVAATVPAENDHGRASISRSFANLTAFRQPSMLRLALRPSSAPRHVHPMVSELL